MKICKSCKKEIDDRAKKCPHCTADQRIWFAKHPIITVILALIVIGMVGSGKGDKNQSRDSNNSTPSTNQAAKTDDSKAEVKTFGINEEVVDKDLAFTVTSVSKKQSLGNSYSKRAAQGVYYVITVKITNKGDSTTTFDSSMAKIGDSQNRQFDHSTDGQIALGMSQGKVDLFLQQVQPSLTYTGDLVFDVPIDIVEPYLIVKGSYFSSGAKIKLQ